MTKLVTVHPIILPTEPFEYMIKFEPSMTITMTDLKSPKFHGTKL